MNRQRVNNALIQAIQDECDAYAELIGEDMSEERCALRMMNTIKRKRILPGFSHELENAFKAWLAEHLTDVVEHE
jgi:hypothetical protein